MAAILGGLLALLTVPPSLAGAAWSPGTAVSPAGQSVQGGDVAADGQGRISAFWTSAEDTGKRVSAASRPAGGTFAAPSTLADFGDGFMFPYPGDGNEPEIAVNASGAALAAYVVQTSSSNTVYVSRRSSAEGAWSTPQAVRTTPQVAHIQIAILSDGSGWAAWLDRDAEPGDVVRASRIAADGTPAPSELAYAMPFASSSGPFSLAADPEDGAAAIVIGGTSGDGEDLTLVRSNAIGWGTPTALTSEQSTFDGDVRAAFEADGDLRVVFARGTTDAAAVRSGVVADGTDTLADAEVAPSSGFGSVRGLDLAIDAGGAAVVAWIDERQSTATTDLRAAALDSGAGAWNVHDLRVDGGWPQLDDAFDPDVVVAPDGTATVGWVELVAGYGSPRAAQRVAGGSWSAAADLPRTDGYSVHRVELAQAPSGVVHAVYLHGNADSTALVHTSTEPLTTPPDVAGPQITITTPAIGQRFTQNADVTADFACTDDVAVALCEGTVADGARLDTSTVGQHSFTVRTRDTAGHESTRTHGYFVDAPAGGGSTGGDTGQQQTVIIRPPTQYHELSPENRPQPTQPTPAQVALTRLDGQVDLAGTAAPSTIKGKALLTGKIDLSFKPLTPNIDIRAGFVIAPGGANVVAGGGLNLISDNGLGVVAAGGLNVIAPGGANVVAAGGLNLIGPAAGNLVARPSSVGPVAVAAAKRKQKALILAKGSKFFATPKAGKVRLKLTKNGRAALRKAFAKRGRQSVAVIYLVGYTERGSNLPTVVTARQIKVRE